MSWRALLAPYIFVTGSLIFALPACWSPNIRGAWGNGSLRYLFENFALDIDRRELRRGAELGEHFAGGESIASRRAAPLGPQEL